MRRHTIERLESRILFTTYYVTTADDVVALDGRLSLREAILAANSNASRGDAEAGSAAGDRILFGSMVWDQTIGITRDLAITDDLVINGGPHGITIESDGTSRIFDINTSEHVRLRSLTLAGGHADLGGGVQLRGGGMSTFQNVHFTDCTADLLGGAVYNVDHGLNYGGGTLDGNDAGLAGGAIYNVGPEVWLHELHIAGNTAEIGGGIYTAGALAVINGLDLSDNTARAGGGGLFVAAGAVSLLDSRVSGNLAPGLTGFGGGAVVTGDAAATFSSVEISNNRAFVHGGGLFNESTALVRLIDSSVTNNYALSNPGSWGGGIFSRGTHLQVTGSLLYNNVARGHGGGIYSNGARLDVLHSSIIANRVESPGHGGGGIAVEVGSLLVDDVAVTHNTSGDSDSFGGGIAVMDIASADIRHATITHNSAPGGGGGVYFNTWGRGAISDSLLSENTAIWDVGGGGVLVVDTPVEIYRCRVIGNVAGAAAVGGGIALQGVGVRGSLLVKDSTIAENRSTGGGGIGVENANPLTLENVDFVGNESVVGGGVYVQGGRPLVVRNSRFIENAASHVGGGIDVAADAMIEDSLFYGNSGGYGGGGIDAGLNLVLVNCTITHNTAVYGGGVRISDPMRLTRTDTVIAENTLEDIGY